MAVGLTLFNVFGGTAVSLGLELPMAGMGRLQSLTLSSASGLSLLHVTQTGFLLVARPVSETDGPVCRASQ